MIIRAGTVDRWIAKPWVPPLLVIFLVVPPFVGFALGGPSVGTAVGAASVALIVVVAVRSRPRGAISPHGRDGIETVLAMALVPIADPATANRVATLVEAAQGAGSPTQTRGDGAAVSAPGYEVLVLAPARPAKVQRWLSDVGPARLDAQRTLALSLATLAASNCRAEGRVVDEDPIQALEDAAAEHGAARVIFIVAGPEFDGAIAEAGERLSRPVHRVLASPPV